MRSPCNSIYDRKTVLITYYVFISWKKQTTRYSYGESSTLYIYYIYILLLFWRRARKKSQHLIRPMFWGFFCRFFSLRNDIFTASTQCLGEIIGVSQGVRYTRERAGEWLIRFRWAYNTVVYYIGTMRKFHAIILYYIILLQPSKVHRVQHTVQGSKKKKKMRKKIVRPCNMAYAHIAPHRRGKGSPNSTWTRNGDKSFTSAHKRLASLTF